MLIVRRLVSERLLSRRFECGCGGLFILVETLVASTINSLIVFSARVTPIYNYSTDSNAQNSALYRHQRKLL